MKVMTVFFITTEDTEITENFLLVITLRSEAYLVN